MWFKSNADGASKHINNLDEKKLTPLHYAARHSNKAVMQILVENGADINRLGDDDMTPLHYAARYGRIVIPRERRRSSLKSPLLSPSSGRIVGEAGDSEKISLLDVVKTIEDNVDVVVVHILLSSSLAHWKLWI